MQPEASMQPASIPKKKKRYASVKFTIQCPTVPGQTVCLVGSIKELKSWDTSKAIRLSAVNYTSEHPVWQTASNVPIPLDTPFEYKFFIIETKPGITWEQLPNFASRGLCLKEKDTYTIRHQFGSPKVQVKKMNLAGLSRSLGELELIKPVDDNVVIFAVFMLPFEITRKNGHFSVKRSDKTLYPGVLSQFREENSRLKWVGLAGLTEYSAEEQVELQAELEKHNACPVFIPYKLLEKFAYYYDYVIAPVFHNFVSYKNGAELGDSELLASYRAVNKAFVEVIQGLQKKAPGAVVLFNDPHLILAPKLLVDPDFSTESQGRMAFFFHSPFPSGEIFRVFPFSEELMESLLCCDLIGFQLYEYARHFFSSCQRLLGLQAEVRWGGMLGILYKGRDVIIRVGHMGISLEYIANVMHEKEYLEEVSRLVNPTAKKVVIAGVDKLSPLTGIKQKLTAFHTLLERHPQYIGKVLLIQYCVPCERWSYIDKTSKEIKEIVKTINKNFPNSVIYEEGELPTYKRLVLFSIAEILLNTPLRDGLLLDPFEYIVVKNFKKANIGKIIMSEFAGYVTPMTSIWRINPYNITEIMDALLNTIDAPPQTTDNSSFQSDLRYTMMHNDERWLLSILTDIKQTFKTNEKAIYLGALSKKVLRANSDFRHLRSSDIEKKYQKSVNRVILLDSEGTLTPIVPQAIIKTAEVVPPKVLQILEALCADERNSVYILSGMPKHFIDRWYSSVPKLGLGAEYGYHYRLNTETTWKTAKWTQSSEWKAVTMRFFQWFKERTDGSDIEIKDNSLVWMYKDCDQELGEWQAQELQKELSYALSEYPNISILHGKGFIDVKPKELEKGELAWEIIEDVRRRKGTVDFILAIGDDIEDEEMFKRVNATCLKDTYKEQGKMYTKACVKFTCTVGKKPSHARYYVNDYVDTINLLQDISLWSVKVW